MKIPAAIKTIKRKRVSRWIKISLIVYGVVGVAVYHFQEKFMFHPEAVDAQATYNFADAHKEVTVPVDATSVYHLVQFTTSAEPRGVVLYFHGNMENVNRYADAAKNFTPNGFEVWMVDYPTFGKSTGKLTEEEMYKQALEVYKMARSRFQPSEIVIYGRSMGSGVAAQLASIRDCKRLILETPYYSLTSVAARYFWMYPLEKMIRFKFPTNEYLANVTAPVTIFHGTEDGVIPLENAVQLKKRLKRGDEFLTIEGGSHNDLGSFELVKQKLTNMLQPPTTLSSRSY